MDWYAVHVRRGCEVEVAQRLAHVFHLTTYCPQLWQRRRGAVQACPLFPGYFFASETCAGETLRAIASTPGSALLRRQPPAASPQDAGRGADGAGCDGDDPFVRLGAALIERLRCCLDAVNAAGGLPAGLLRQPGGGQMEKRGLEAALDGVLEPSARVSVLLQVCHSQPSGGEAGEDVVVEAEAAANAEGTAEGERPLKRTRRTRGHGRWIHYL